MSSSPSQRNAAISSVATGDEIDLRQVIGALSRRRYLITAIAIFSLLFSWVDANKRKPVWEGQFQIVLKKQNSANSGIRQLAGSNPMLATLAGLSGNASSSLETEIKILESPSVLKPVYNYVVEQKTSSGENIDGYKFSSWLPNLDIELIPGTTVLEIAYQDTNKELVLPVIEKISQAYQKYSGRDHSRGLTQAVSYVEEQLSTLRIQANQSMRDAHVFALSNGLALQDGMPTAITAGNVNLYAQLQGLKALLQEKSALLRVSDPYIQTLQRRIRALTKVINQQTDVPLEGDDNAKLTSIDRSREVVIKHRELVRTALRDEKTVTELGSQLQSLRLEKARQTEPWELISTPTLLDSPVGPDKQQIITLGLFTGLVVGSGLALLIDRRTGLVFSIDELKTILPYPLLKHLPALNPAVWNDATDLLARGPLATACNSPIALVPIGDIQADQLQAFATELRRALSGREVLVSSDLRETSECATQILITAPGVATRTQLSHLNQKLALQGSPLAGWVLLVTKVQAESVQWDAIEHKTKKDEVNQVGWNEPHQPFPGIEQNTIKWIRVDWPNGNELPSNQIVWEELTKEEIKLTNEKIIEESSPRPFQTKAISPSPLQALDRSIAFQDGFVGPDISWSIPNGLRWSQLWLGSASWNRQNRGENTSGSNQSKGGDNFFVVHNNIIQSGNWSIGLNTSINNRTNLSQTDSRRNNNGAGISSGFRVATALGDTAGIAFGGEQVIQWDDKTNIGRNLYLMLTKGWWLGKQGNDYPLLVTNGGVGTGRYTKHDISTQWTNPLRFACIEGLESRSRTLSVGNNLCWGPIGSVSIIFNDYLSSFVEYHGGTAKAGASLSMNDGIPLRLSLGVDFLHLNEVVKPEDFIWSFKASVGF